MEQHKRKKIIEFLILTGFMVLAALLVDVKGSAAEPRLPEPAAINEPIKTYYIGNMALDMPESWESGSIIDVTFYLTDQKNSPEINFKDSPLSKNHDTSDQLKKKIDSVEKTKGAFEKQAETIVKADLSETFSRPAAIIVSDIAPRPSPFVDNVDPDTKRLEMSLFLAEPESLLRFNYSENIVWPSEQEKNDIVADRQKKLIDWVNDFLPRYQWVGHNAPQPKNFLVTENGRIAIGDDFPELRYKLTAHFRQPISQDWKIGRYLSLWLISYPEWPRRYSRTNRTVGGHPGYETKSLVNFKKDMSETGLDRLKFWKPKAAFMFLSWEDRSTQPPSQEQPAIDIRQVSFSETRGFPDIAYILGVWDIMLDSVRPATASDLKEQ